MPVPGLGRRRRESVLLLPALCFLPFKPTVGLQLAELLLRSRRRVRVPRDGLGRWRRCDEGARRSRRRRWRGRRRWRRWWRRLRLRRRRDGRRIRVGNRRRGRDRSMGAAREREHGRKADHGQCGEQCCSHASHARQPPRLAQGPSSLSHGDDSPPVPPGFVANEASTGFRIRKGGCAGFSGTFNFRQTRPHLRSARRSPRRRARSRETSPRSATAPDRCRAGGDGEKGRDSPRRTVWPSRRPA